MHIERLAQISNTSNSLESERFNHQISIRRLAIPVEFTYIYMRPCGITSRKLIVICNELRGSHGCKKNPNRMQSSKDIMLHDAKLISGHLNPKP